MTEPGAAIDKALAAFEGTALEKVGEHVRFEPVNLGLYRETFVQMGFQLPEGLEAFVSARGLLRVPDLGSPFELPSGSSGLHMADPDELFDAFLHLDEAIEAGRDVARSWVLIALVHPRRYDGAYALMEGDLGVSEPPIGYYTGDGAKEAAPEAGLPERFESFDALIARYAGALSGALVRGDRAGIARAMRTLGRTAPAGSDWRRVWSEHERGKLDWSEDTAARFKPVMAGADDPAIVEKLLRRIHAELDDQSGRPRDPRIEQAFARGAWPRDLPGPDELMARLPEEGASGLRGVARFCLSFSGLSPTDASLVEGRALLDAMCEGEGEVDDEHRKRCLAACAAIASPARGITIQVADAEAFYARALTWSLGRLTAERVRHVASLAMRLFALARTDAGKAAGLEVPNTVQPFGFPALFQKLSSIVRGRPDELPSLLRQEVERPRDLPVHDALKAFLEAHEGAQREKLKDLEQEWTTRLKGAAEPDRAWCVRLLQKKLNSKKIRTERDAWLDTLGT